jgi:magnesium transporter
MAAIQPISPEFPIGSLYCTGNNPVPVDYGAVNTVSETASGQEPFWLDLPAVSQQQAGWLEHIFGLHPLVVEDAQQFDERPKLDQFDDYIAVIVYGAGAHPSLDRLAQRADVPGDSGADAADVSPLDPLSELSTYRSALIPLRRVLTSQEDVFATLSSGKVRVPGAGDDLLPYLRDVHDHIKKLSDTADSFRDLIIGTAAAYSSGVSNQLNVVMKQLAVISTVFLPLTFLTGFFGQNFGALIGHIETWQEFMI